MQLLFLQLGEAGQLGCPLRSTACELRLALQASENLNVVLCPLEGILCLLFLIRALLCLLAGKGPEENATTNLVVLDQTVINQPLVHLLDHLLHNARFVAFLLDLFEVKGLLGVTVNLEQRRTLLLQALAFLGPYRSSSPVVS